VNVLCGSFGCVHINRKGVINKYFVDKFEAKIEAKTNGMLMKLMPEYYKFTLLSTTSNIVHTTRTAPPSVVNELGDGELYFIRYIRGRGDAYKYMQKARQLTACKLVQLLLTLHRNFVTVMHKRGLWHTDIKLENLVLTTDRARLIDFGMAQLFKDGMTFPTFEDIGHNMSPLTVLATIAILDGTEPKRFEDIAEALVHAWGSDRYTTVTRIWGGSGAYLRMVSNAFSELVSDNYAIGHHNKWMMNKCDDYGMAFAVLDLCPDTVLTPNHLTQVRKMLCLAADGCATPSRDKKGRGRQVHLMM